jgi:hypothetical protein
MFKAGRADAVGEKLADLQAGVQEMSDKLASISRALSAKEASPPRGGALLKYLGVAPDRFLERYYEESPENDFYEALYGGSESLRGRPAEIGLKSGLCRQIHFSTDEYRYWMSAMGRRPRMHRKDWEWFYIAQAMFERGMLQQGKRGLVFAVGQEPLPSLFATYGCDIRAGHTATCIARKWKRCSIREFARANSSMRPCATKTPT